MVELISLKGKKIRVPSSVAESYLKLGFSKVDDKRMQPLYTAIGNSDYINNVINSAFEGAGEGEDEFSELLEKPIAQWRKNEIIAFATAKQINISGTKNINEAREVVKQFLASQEDKDEQDSSGEWD